MAGNTLWPHPAHLSVRPSDRCCRHDQDVAIARVPSRLTRYTEALFESAPSIQRGEKIAPWAIYGDEWKCRDILYVSAGAFLSAANDPFRGLTGGLGLDVQIGVEFLSDGEKCVLHLRGDTDTGKSLVGYLASLPSWGSFVTIKVSN